ncbi:MAG: excisionase family DNA-binding protein [Dehalococcoidia bacterium]|nr:excisionase family DNA-binding protein [Dehalococcoidia bacterium]
MEDTEKLVISVDEAAKLLALSRSSAYAGVKNGQIPSIKVGRRILIPRAALLAKLAGGGAAQGSGAEGARSDGRS